MTVVELEGYMAAVQRLATIRGKAGNTGGKQFDIKQRRIRSQRRRKEK